MKSRFLNLAAVAVAVASVAMCGCLSRTGSTAKAEQRTTVVASSPKVYFTSNISPESLVRLYNKLNRKVEGRVAVKLSTGEPGGHNYLKPELIGEVVKLVGGTIVECNTAYGGGRATTEAHLKTAREHGFT